MVRESRGEEIASVGGDHAVEGAVREGGGAQWWEPRSDKRGAQYWRSLDAHQRVRRW